VYVYMIKTAVNWRQNGQASPRDYLTLAVRTRPSRSSLSFFATTVNSPSFPDEYPQAQLICFILVYTISMEDESAYEWFCEQYDGNEIAQGLI